MTRKGKGTAVAPDRGAGFFSALVRQHDWPPGFVSAWPANGVNTALLAQASRANREAGVGFAGAGLRLPGAAEHIERWRKQRTVAP